MNKQVEVSATSNLEDKATLQSELASLQKADGTTDVREQLCLWVLRTRYDIDREDSFEYVFTPPANIRLEGAKPAIDGFVIRFDGAIPVLTLLIYIESAFDGKLSSSKVAQVSELVSLITTDQFELFESLKKTNRRTREVVLRSELESQALREAEWRIVIVTPGDLGTSAESKLIESAKFPFATEVLDIFNLRSFARAITEPGTIDATVKIQKKEGGWIYTTKGKAPVLIAPLQGEEIVRWGGIQDRRLFDLNVRFGLGMNRVRKSLDDALHAQDKGDFLASHNGITVVCDFIEEREEEFIVHGLSVVNGAQSIIALAENRDHIGPNLHIVVKFVEVGKDKDEAARIAVRSNTQNPVSSRNLRALDDKQLELQNGLSALGYNYVLRPDTKTTSRHKTIRNDDAAQWLCGLYLEEPALAVKRQALFQPGNYERIFGASIEARHIVLASKLRIAIEATRPNYPEPYSRSWSLVALTAMYLCGQMLRATKSGYTLLHQPDIEGAGAGRLESELTKAAEKVCDFLTQRHRELAHGEATGDNFKVDFKNSKKLNEMKLQVQRRVSRGVSQK